MKLRIVSVLVMALVSSGCWEYSKGEKIGTIIKLEQSGLFCKTWEATMIRGGFIDGSGVAGTTVSMFTIEREEMVPTVKRLMEQQKPVRAVFRREVATFCRSDSADTFLLAIEAQP